MFFQEQGIYMCTHTHTYMQATHSSILCIIFQKKLAEKISHQWTKARKANWKAIFIFDLWDWIPLWFPTLHCAVGKTSLRSRPSTIWVLQQQLQWRGLLSPYLQPFPAPCFSKMGFQVGQHHWSGDVLKPTSVNRSELKISSHSLSFPHLFAVFLFSCIVSPVHLPVLHRSQVCWWPWEEWCSQPENPWAQTVLKSHPDITYYYYDYYYLGFGQWTDTLESYLFDQ